MTKVFQGIMVVVIGLTLLVGVWWFYHIPEIEQDLVTQTTTSSSVRGTLEGANQGDKEESAPTSTSEKEGENGSAPNATDSPTRQTGAEKQESVESARKTSAEDLISVVNHLFETVYNYHSDQEAGSVAARKEMASQWANDNALNQLFPKDADQLRPSVTTVSQLEKAPEIYAMMLVTEQKPEPTQKALVLVHYAVTIAGSRQQKSAFLYQVTFDIESKQVTNIRNLGELSGF